MLAGTEQARMPDLPWGRHLVDGLMEIGPAATGPAGPVAVSFAEIRAWAAVTRTELPGHEALLMRELSRDYCREFFAARDKFRPRPADDEEEARAAGREQFAQLARRFGR